MQRSNPAAQNDAQSGGRFDLLKRRSDQPGPILPACSAILVLDRSFSAGPNEGSIDCFICLLVSLLGSGENSETNAGIDLKTGTIGAVAANTIDHNMKGVQLNALRAFSGERPNLLLRLISTIETVEVKADRILFIGPELRVNYYWLVAMAFANRIFAVWI